MATGKKLTCLSCGQLNRVPEDRLNASAKCGVCGEKLLSSKALEVDAEVLAKAARNDDLPLVADFWAPWCGPCRSFAPVYEAVAAAQPTRARFLKLDTQANPNTAAQFQIRSIPTLMVFCRGREVARLSGALPRPQFEQWLDQQLAGLR